MSNGRELAKLALQYSNVPDNGKPYGVKGDLLKEVVDVSDIAFTIIYPNGGSEASPANVTSNSRYVLANPFSGHHALCEVEIYTAADGWYSPGWYSLGSGAAGARASQKGEEIVISTGISSLSTGFQWGGGGTSSSSGSGITVNAPCRVKVWKVKGAIA